MHSANKPEVLFGINRMLTNLDNLAIRQLIAIKLSKSFTKEA